MKRDHVARLQVLHAQVHPLASVHLVGHLSFENKAFVQRGRATGESRGENEGWRRTKGD